MRGDLTTGSDPQTDRPNHASGKPTWSFHERYASDAEFKRQVDEARKRAAQERTKRALDDSLAMSRGERKKLY